jgi:hypothetical protein
MRIGSLFMNGGDDSDWHFFLQANKKALKTHFTRNIYGI